jgi:Glycosyltransferase Family 4
MRKGLAVRFLEWLEVMAYRNADHNVSVTQSFVPHIAACGGNANKIAVIKNGVDLELHVLGMITAGSVERRADSWGGIRPILRSSLESR